MPRRTASQRLLFSGPWVQSSATTVLADSLGLALIVAGWLCSLQIELLRIRPQPEIELLRCFPGKRDGIVGGKAPVHQLMVDREHCKPVG